MKRLGLYLLCIALTAVMFFTLSACVDEGNYHTKADTEAMLKTLETALGEKISANEVAIKALNDEYTAKIAELEAANVAHKVEYDALTAAHNKAVADLTAAGEATQSELDALEEKHAEDKAALEQAMADNKAAAEAALKALEDKHNTDKAELISKGDATQAELDALEEKHAEDKAALEQAMADNKAVTEAALKALEDKHNTDKAELISKNEATQAELNTLIATYNTAVADINGKIAANETAIGNAKTELQNKLDTLAADHNSEIATINGLIGDLQNADTVSEARIAELEKKVTELLSAHKHVFGDWIDYSGNANVYCESRLFYRICTTCHVLEWKSGTHDNHNFTAVTIAPTCQAGGFDTKTCTICGKVELESYTEKIPHSWQGVYSYDNTYHWYGCENCSDVTGKGTHTLDAEGYCAVCHNLVWPYSVEAATLPHSLIKFLSKSFSQNFQDREGTYKVGADNPFRFNLTLDTWDVVNNEPGDIITSYVSLSKVYLITGATEQLLTGDELAAYVTIDENNNTFDFTDAAIGKNFRIETRPAQYVNEADAALVAAVTKSLPVEVVNGYNVYDAKELNLLTNGNSDDITQYGQTLKSQVLLCYEFLQNNNITAPEGGIRGIVLHCDLSITVDDIPEGYLYTYTNKAGQDVKELYDHFSVYYCLLDTYHEEFGFWGNYFTINTSGLPCVAEPGHAGNLVNDPASSTNVFTFRVNRFEYNNFYNGVQYGKELDYDYTDYHTLIENVFVTGDDPNSNDESIAARSMRGLTAFRAQLHVVDFYNVIVEQHLTSLGCSGDTLEVNLNKCYFFNAWSSHIFAWNTNTVMNDLQIDYVTPADWANYSPMKINIQDSTIAKCGGPVIASSTATPNHFRNALSGAEITVKGGCDLWTYVQGSEAWFAANNLTPLVTNLIQVNGIIQMASQGTASYTSPQENMSGEFMNLVYVNTSPRGSFTIENGASINPQAATVAPYIQATGGQAPVFQSSAGGVGYFNGTTIVGATAELFRGDYFNIFYGGNSIFVGYYH